MHIVALAWIYVVSMMAITEKTVTAGLLTFVLYCAFPLGLVWFILARRKNYYRKPDQAQESTDVVQQHHDSNKS